MELVELVESEDEFFRERVRFARRSGASFDIHLTRPAGVPPPVTKDHIFILGAMCAFALAEDYEQSLPASEEIIHGFDKAQEIWRSWRPYRRKVSVSAQRAPDAASHSMDDVVDDRDVAAFFSGGVDSLYTTTKLGPKITSLISIAHVADEPTAIRGGFDRLAELSPYAQATNRKHYFIASNLMTAVPEVHDAWAYLSHGAALAAVAHALSGSIRAAEISSTYAHHQLIPWGSHPSTDPLFSTRTLRVGHFGADVDRVQKTFRIAEDPDALSILSVCGEGRLPGPFVNCSGCQKCLRTMMTLDLANVDRRLATTFDWSGYAPAKAEDIFLRTEGEYVFAREIRNKADALARSDVSKPIGRMMDKSRRYIALARSEMFLRQRFPAIARAKTKLVALRSIVYRLFGLKRQLNP
ncbi:MAG: hypothetical protein AAFX08_09145 [Pseudomonadota bacterium]